MEERLLTQKNEIVVYQPSETLRLEVRLQDESIWLPQQKIADLFGVKKAAISKHLKNIFATGELHEELVVSKMETTTRHGAIGGKVQHHLISLTRRNLPRHSPITRNSIRPCRLRSRATRSRTIASSSLTTRCGTSVPRSRMRVPRSSR